jgi:putative membrane protein
MMRFGYGPMQSGGGGYLMMAVIMAAVAILVILGIIALVRYIRVSGHSHRFQMVGVNPAIQILNERYAKGEITDEEYKVKKLELGK